jgi:hypothetical protein
LHETLGFTKYSDTLWVVNALRPGVFDLGQATRRGPQKSPDYVAEDQLGNFSVLECKGTQTSHKSLHDAIYRGRPQKENLQASSGTNIHHSLVAGLFIPQFENTESPAIAIADPDWQEAKAQLSEFSREELGRGISQIAFAKELALLDLAQTANCLARAKRSEESVVAAFHRDRDTQTPNRTIALDEVRVRHDYFWPQPTKISQDLVISGIRFEGSLPQSEIERLEAVVSPFDLADRKREQGRETKWQSVVGDVWAELRSPLGSTLRLTMITA